MGRERGAGDRQTDRQTDTDTDRQTDRQTDRDRENEFIIYESNGLSYQSDTFFTSRPCKERWGGGIQTDRQTETETETHRQTNREQKQKERLSNQTVATRKFVRPLHLDP